MSTTPPNAPIRITVPSIDEDDIAAVAAVLRSGFLVQGPKVAEFENLFASYVGSKFAVATTNCTEALFLSLLALKVGPLAAAGGSSKDKVAVCTYSWPATANAAILVGAEPVFVEVDPNTFNMDPAALDAVLSGPSGKEIKAVIPVHTFGGPADMLGLAAVCKKHGVPMVEDDACALGTEVGGKRAGSFGATGCFSLHPRKAITTGEGGMITTDDENIANHMRVMRNHGMAVNSPKIEFVEAGHNLRMTEFQAALGISQFGKLERIIGARRAGASHYDSLFAGSSVQAPQVMAGGKHVYQSYVVLLPKGTNRDQVITTMRERGVETTLGTYHMPLIKLYRERYGFKPGMFPVTDDLSARTLTLPLYEGLLPESREMIAKTLLAVLG
jgi:perosamine synthetase